jgi:hypothetical protein
LRPPDDPVTVPEQAQTMEDIVRWAARLTPMMETALSQNMVIIDLTTIGE